MTHEAELILSCKATGTAEIEEFDDAVVRADEHSAELKNTLAGLFSTAAVLAFGKKAIDTFSDLQEATQKFGEVFKGVEDEATKQAKLLEDQFGASARSARSMLSLTGDLLTGFGFSREEALKLSVQVAQLGSDIASFSNYAGGAEGATQAITKAMLGETESAKMLGIAIKTDSEEYKELYKQIKESRGETDSQTKALTALQIAFQQKGNAMGDFSRNIDSIANRGRMLSNEMEDLQANIGRGLSEGFNEGQAALIGLLRSFNELSQPTQDFITKTGLIFSGLMIAKTAASAYNFLSGQTGAIAVNNSVSLAAETNAHIANTNALRHETAEKTKSALAENKLQILSAKNAYKKAVAAGEDPSKVSQLRDEYKKLLVTRQDLRQQFNDRIVDKNLGKWGHTVAMTNKQMNIMAKKSFPMLNGATSMLRSGFNGVSVAARSIGVAMKGVLTSMLPMLALSLAIQGVMWLVNRRSEQNKAALDIAKKETEQVQKQIDEQKKLRDLDNDKMRRYEELAKLTDRTEEEQKELVRITGELNKGYNGLNAPLLKQNETLEDTAKLWETIKKKQKEQQEQELKALAFVKKQESDARLLTTYDAFGSSNQHKERLEYISNITNRKEQERQLNEFLALLKRNKNSEAYSAVLAYRMSLRSIDSIRNQYRDLVSGKTEEKNANAENRKLAEERRKLSEKYNEKLKRDQFDQMEIQDKIARKEKDLAEYRDQERYYAQRDKTSENVKKLYEFKTKILETEKELRNLHAQSAEAMKQENDEIMRQAKELEDKKLQKAREVYDALQQQKQAQVSIWQELYNAGRSYRETAQSAFMTNSEQAIRMQSRVLFAPKLNTAEMAQKQTAATATEIRKILDEWKQKSDSLNTEVQTIARNLQVTDYQ